MPSVTDWLMVAITAIYVIATILICVFNGKSANAAKKQTAEMQRQFYETNRPNITVEIVSIRNAIWALRFTNIGPLTAYNVQIKLNQAYIKSLPESKIKEIAMDNDDKVRTICSGKYYDYYLGVDNCIKSKDAMPITGQRIYKGVNSSIYAEDFEIDMAKYATILTLDSDWNLLLKKIDSQNAELKEIKKELSKLNKCNAEKNIDG